MIDPTPRRKARGFFLQPTKDPMPKIPHDPATELDIRADTMRREAKDHRGQAEELQTRATDLFEKANLLDAAAEKYDETVKLLRGPSIKGDALNTGSIRMDPSSFLASLLGGIAGCDEPDCPACNPQPGDDPDAAIKAMIAARFGVDPDQIQVIR